MDYQEPRRTRQTTRKSMPEQRHRSGTNRARQTATQTEHAVRQRTATTKSARPASSRRRAPARSQTTVQRAAARNSGARQTRKKRARMFDRRFRTRLITTLALAAAVILCFVVFFRVNTISISGNDKYTQEEILSASGIEKGDALLLVNKSAAAGKIMAKLPYVDELRIGVAFPNVVRIEVKELETAYALAASDGSYWLVNSTGRVVEETTVKAAAGYLQLTGFQIEPPEPGETIRASKQTVTQTTEDTAQTSDNTEEATPKQRMETALEILQALEASGSPVGITEIDMSDFHNIKVLYGTQYEVDLGAAVDLTYKVEYMLAAVEQLDDYESGVLDLTFQEEKVARFIPWKD